MTVIDQVHALLFVADQPVGLNALANALELTEGQVEQALELLEKKLKKAGPIQVVRLAGGYQLSTKPSYAHMVSAFLQPQRSRLSRSLMEVLAIVAYRQPLTIGEIEVIRGVQSDHPVRSLLERRLIREVGRRPTPGRPILYGTSDQFLHHFKMNALADLPVLEAGIPDAEPRALESRLDQEIDEEN